MKCFIEKVNAGVWGSWKTPVKKTLDAECPHCGCEVSLEYTEEKPRMGVVSAFTFGRGVGTLHAFLVAASIVTEEVSPVSWQTALRCRTGGDKNVSKRKAQQLFPAVKVTHGNADGLLLAEYCRRHETGILTKGKTA